MMKKNTDDIGKELLTVLPADRIKTRYIDLVTFGSDAGFYYLLPRAVVHPVSEDEIAGLFDFSHRRRIPLVFRAGAPVFPGNRSRMGYSWRSAGTGTGYRSSMGAG